MLQKYSAAHVGPRNKDKSVLDTAVLPLATRPKAIDTGIKLGASQVSSDLIQAAQD